MEHPETYIWQVAGKRVEVHLDLDVVDRLYGEVMRGFGVVPKRGVEVGGILLGKIEQSGDQYIVEVEDYEPVGCSHSRGGSYMLSEEEQGRMGEAAARWGKEAGRGAYAVGYYRSHTRQGLGLTSEDVELYERYFPDAGQVALVVKPFATRTSVGAIFFREEGSILSVGCFQVFPFRRAELEAEKEVRGGKEEMASTTIGNPVNAGTSAAQEQVSEAAPQGKERDGGGKRKTGWFWIPLSFVFLLLGVLIGVSTALNFRVNLPGPFRVDPYHMNLSVAQAGPSLLVSWDRNSQPIQMARRGTLVIRDGGGEKTVQLDAGQLRLNGSILYNRASDVVHFRLEVMAGDRLSVVENLEYRAVAASAR